MTPESLVEILRAYLKNERLCLCREVDTAFPLDGLTETLVLYELVSILEDADEWGEVTQRIPRETMSELMEASK